MSSAFSSSPRRWTTRSRSSHHLLPPQEAPNTFGVDATCTTRSAVTAPIRGGAPVAGNHRRRGCIRQVAEGLPGHAGPQRDRRHDAGTVHVSRLGTRAGQSQREPGPRGHPSRPRSPPGDRRWPARTICGRSPRSAPSWRESPWRGAPRARVSTIAFTPGVGDPSRLSRGRKPLARRSAGRGDPGSSRQAAPPATSACSGPRTMGRSRGATTTRELPSRLGPGVPSAGAGRWDRSLRARRRELEPGLGHRLLRPG